MSLDRLSTLFHQVHFKVIPTIEGQTNPTMAFVQESPESITLNYFRLGAPSTHYDSIIGLDFGGSESALYLAIPDYLGMTITPTHAAWAIAQTTLQEIHVPRCGGPVMLDRLIEVLMIYLLRDAIEVGQQAPGMLLGLADPQLKHALVAIHDTPDIPWTVDELANRSGVSRTVFYKRFNEKVGCSPSHYLRQWRLTLARGQLLRGKRISQVAKSIGYQSNEGFSRAFHQHFGEWPSEVG